MQRDHRAVRLVDRHLAAAGSTEHCRELIRQLSTRRKNFGGGLTGKVAWTACRLLLLYAFCTVSLRCLESSFPTVSESVRTGRALSYLNLVYLKAYRWLSVQVGLYRSEFLHSRDRQSCLVSNPFFKVTELCCDCPQQIRIRSVSLNSAAGRGAYRATVDRHVAPFRVIDSGHRPVSFDELRRTVLGAWQDVSSGSNRVASLPSDGPSTLAELLQPEQPTKSVRLVSWTFGHMSAIRAVRKLVPRPPFIRPDVDIALARAFYLLTGDSGSGSPEDTAVGDLSQFQGQAVLMGLHGSLRVTLSHKPGCCPGSHGNASAVLSPGQAMVVPTSCFQVHFGRHGISGEAYTLVYILNVYSSTGINQAAPVTGRVPQADDIED